MALLETVLHSFVSFAMLLFEYIGVAVITFAGIQGLVNCIRKAPDTRLILAKGLAMGLEFKLGSEILRTVIVRNLEEIYIVAGIIVLRAILTILIHWEIKNEKKEEQGRLPDKNAADTEDVPSADSAASIDDAKTSVNSRTDKITQATDSKKTAEGMETTDSK